MPVLHSLKVHPQFWDSLKDGSKRFELRRNDRNFRVGDRVDLRAYNPSYGFGGVIINAVITNVLLPEDCPGLMPGFCIFSFNILVIHE